MKQLTKEQILRYELYSSRWMHYISLLIGTNIVSSIIARKVKRKYKRYAKSLSEMEVYINKAPES